jgi:crotonobetaine/carnitine-CoA ligase
MTAPRSKDYPTIAEQLRRAAAKHGDRPWIVTAERHVTYREMDELSDRLAHGLAELGIEKGQTVLVMLPNTIDFVLVFAALGKLGALQVPINTAYRGGIFTHVLNDSLATTMIVDRQHLDNLEAIEPTLERLDRLVLYTEGGSPAAPDVLPPGLAKRCQALKFEDIYSKSNERFESDTRYNELMGVLYTSGTTGPSKGVMTTYAHCYDYSSGPMVSGMLREGDVYYAPLPLFHIGGMWAVVYACCIAGATAVLPPGFSVSNFWDDVRTYNVNVAFILGAMVNFIYQQPRRPDDADNPLERIVMAPVPADFNDFMERFGIRIWTAYGSTETSCPIWGDGNPPNAESCGGLVSDQWEMRIVDDNDVEVPNGTVGEAVIRSRDPWVMMAGYWNNPEATMQAWRNQWMHSGDLLKRDDEGYFYFVDRKKDAIRRRGENISSMEVEEEVHAHPAVLEAAVFPVKSEHAEDEVMAAIVLKPGESVAPDEMIRFLEPRMAYFMVPRFLDFIDELPKTSTGKVKKYSLRESGVTGTTWDREAAGIKLKR